MKGHVRKVANGWRVRWELPRDPAKPGERRRQWGPLVRTKREAQRMLHEGLAAAATGAYVERSKVTLDAYFDVWMQRAAIDLRASTADSYRRVYGRYVRERLGAAELQALTATRLNTLYAELMRSGGASGAPISAGTCRHVHVLLRRVLGSALKEGLVVRNPAEVAEPPRQRKASHTVWDSEQLAAFIRASAAEPLGALWRFYAVTGCRRGEALGLSWSDVNLDEGRAEIRRTLIVLEGRATFGEPKTAAGRRSIALDDETVARLRAHRKRQAEDKLAFGAAYQDSGLVFCWEDGSPLNPNVVTRRFYRILERAGLPKIRLHDVRHSAVTAMLRAGIPAKVISERVGHASVSFTLDVYASVLPSMQEAAAARLAAVLDGIR